MTECSDVASRVIGIMGQGDRAKGIKLLAEIASKTTTTVSRWTYSRDKRGTGGLIPAEYHDEIMRHALANGIPLQAKHFFDSLCGSPDSPL